MRVEKGEGKKEAKNKEHETAYNEISHASFEMTTGEGRPGRTAETDERGVATDGVDAGEGTGAGCGVRRGGVAA